MPDPTPSKDVTVSVAEIEHLIEAASGIEPYEDVVAIARRWLSLSAAPSQGEPTEQWTEAARLRHKDLLAHLNYRQKDNIPGTDVLWLMMRAAEAAAFATRTPHDALGEAMDALGTIHRMLAKALAKHEAGYLMDFGAVERANRRAAETYNRMKGDSLK